MIVSINQPAYLPWLGYFERIARSDIHIVLDHVQFEKNSFTNRNRIRGKSGPTWLTIPIATKGRFGDLAINSLKFAPFEVWQKKHWASLKMNYCKARNFIRYAGAYEALYAEPWPAFMPFAKEMLMQHLCDLGIGTPLLFSSELGVSGQKSNLILNLCSAVGARVYLSGSQGVNYLDERAFCDAGVLIQYQNYRHPQYQQCGAGFESHLGILDLLFNQGPESLKVILANQNP